MRLELDSEGKLYIRDITNDAWDYITKLRNLAGDPWDWYFSKTPNNGSVRVYYNSYNFADDKLMGYLDELIGFYGMQYSASVGLVLQSWRDTCARQKGFVELLRENRKLEDNIRYFRAILPSGCKRCGNFCIIRNGDDIEGYCRLDGKYIHLDYTPLSFAYGDFDNNGVGYMGSKYFPHKGCKYLEIEGEKV